MRKFIENIRWQYPDGIWYLREIMPGPPVDMHYICCHPIVNSVPRVAGTVTAVTTPSISPAPATSPCPAAHLSAPHRPLDSAI